jgi:hypothetical protein
VTPEAAEHLDKAREALSKARGLLDVMHYSDEAARAAYLAGFHAARYEFPAISGLPYSSRVRGSPQRVRVDL